MTFLLLNLTSVLADTLNATATARSNGMQGILTIDSQSGATLRSPSAINPITVCAPSSEF